MYSMAEERLRAGSLWSRVLSSLVETVGRCCKKGYLMIDALDARFKVRMSQFTHRLPPSVKRIVLFGSRAMGSARPDSDYDVAIFVSDRADLCAVRKVAARISMELFQVGLDFRPVVLSFSRLQEQSEFLDHIRSHGHALFLNDEI